MSSICGIARVDGNAVAEAEVTAMLSVLDYWKADRRHSSIIEGAGMGHLLSAVSTEALLERQPRFDAEAGLLISADCRLDNRDDLARELGIESTQLRSIADSEIVLRAYKRWADDCVQRIRGDFAFAIWDARDRRLFCARDPLGIKPFFYSVAAGWFAFASEMKGLLALPFISRDINELWIADYLHGLILDHHSTLYSNIQRLEPGHVLTFSSKGVSKFAYWPPATDAQSRFKREQEYLEAFREKFQATIRRHLSTDCFVGAELSGGLDSSAICAVALQQLRADRRTLHTFAQLADPNYDGHLPPDGREALALFCEHSGITDCAHITGAGAGVLDTLDWANRNLDEPPRVLAALYNDLLHDAAAAAGVRVLLSGWGGNQGISEPGSDVDKNRWNPREWLSWLSGKFSRNESTQPYWQRFSHLPLRDDLCERLAVRERAQQLYDSYSQPRAGADRIMFRLTAPDISARMEIANLATTARRMEYRYPLLDVDLIEFFLGIPTEFTQRRGVSRYFFRRTAEPWLPREICWSTKRASANPSAISRRRRDSSELRRRFDDIPAHSRVHNYVDAKKLSFTMELKGPSFRRQWERENDLLKVLMLDHKLSDATR